MTRSLVITFVFASSCASTTLLGDARVLAPRQVQAALEPAFTFDPFEWAYSPNPASVAAAVRVGLPGRFDVGLRAFTTGGSIEARFQAHQSDRNPGSVDLLVAARGGARASNVCELDVCRVQALASMGTYSAAGINIARWFVVVVGLQAIFELNRNVARLSLGANLGLRFMFNDWFGLMPEYSITLPALPVPALVPRHEAGLALIVTFASP
ncbi:MAG: hypothetical protein QM817_18025 [Archangium sp.]